MHIDLKFNLILEWLDHNVEWVNLKADNHLNTLSNIELDKLWLPKVLFQNWTNNGPPAAGPGPGRLWPPSNAPAPLGDAPGGGTAA